MLERPEWSIERRRASAGDDLPPLASLAGLLGFVRRFGRMVAGIVAICMATALVYLYGATPVYRARAQLLIESKVPHSFIEQISEAFVALDTPQIESQLALLRSEQIAELVVRKLDLVDDAELLGRVPSWSLFGTRVASQTPPSSTSAQPAASPDPNAARSNPSAEQLRSAIAGLQARMEARRVGLSYAIDISYASSSPATAALMANAIADAYVEDRLRTRAHSARQGSEWLEQRIAEIRRQMNAAALDVQEFRARRDYRIIGRNDRGAAIDSEQRVADARAAGSSSSTSAVAHDKETQTLEELEARAHTFRKIYESYLQGYAESVQRQSFPVTNDRVITRATRPDRKSHPQRLLLLAATGILSVMMGVGIALLLYSLDEFARLVRQQQASLASDRRADAATAEATTVT